MSASTAWPKVCRPGWEVLCTCPMRSPFRAINRYRRRWIYSSRPDLTPLRLRSELRTLARDQAPNAPVADVQALSDIMSASIGDFRSTIHVFIAFAAAAILLAVVGIYGLVSYWVTQRTYEISLRIAIGATRQRIVSMILGQGLRVACLRDRRRPDCRACVDSIPGQPALWGWRNRSADICSSNGAVADRGRGRHCPARLACSSNRSGQIASGGLATLRERSVSRAPDRHFNHVVDFHTFGGSCISMNSKLPGCTASTAGENRCRVFAHDRPNVRTPERRGRQCGATEDGLRQLEHCCREKLSSAYGAR